MYKKTRKISWCLSFRGNLYIRIHLNVIPKRTIPKRARKNGAARRQLRPWRKQRCVSQSIIGHGSSGSSDGSNSNTSRCSAISVKSRSDERAAWQPRRELRRSCGVPTPTTTTTTTTTSTTRATAMMMVRSLLASRTQQDEICWRAAAVGGIVAERSSAIPSRAIPRRARTIGRVCR